MLAPPWGGLATRAEAFRAPLYVGWQLTNACDLACVHCIEESGPGRAFKDEMTLEEAFRVVSQLKSEQVPYVAFSGGEPFKHPHFMELVASLAGSGVALKVETNGLHLTDSSCAALREHGVRAVQVSLDAANAETYRRMRPGGDFDKVLSGIRTLRSRGVELEVNFAPTRFNIHEVGAVADLSFALGAGGFYTGRLILAGHAAKAGDLEPTEERYEEFFRMLRGKAAQYRGRMAVRFHSRGIAAEVRYRMANPAALFVILPDGRVKLLNALPFVCGDLREASLSEVWRSFLKGWRSPKVAQFGRELDRDPAAITRLHRWIRL
ncbi:MAG: radical SAM protein [Elusimicrobia bacterium]|nr:radical SAM protein [Elusimicrobiota bacterium]